MKCNVKKRYAWKRSPIIELHIPCWRVWILSWGPMGNQRVTTSQEFKVKAVYSCNLVCLCKVFKIKTFCISLYLWLPLRSWADCPAFGKPSPLGIWVCFYWGENKKGAVTKSNLQVKKITQATVCPEWVIGMGKAWKKGGCRRVTVITKVPHQHSRKDVRNGYDYTVNNHTVAGYILSQR